MKIFYLPPLTISQHKPKRDNRFDCVAYKLVFYSTHDLSIYDCV